MTLTNTLGRYQILREIARSNDIVYEAVDPAGGRKIALKELQVAGNVVGQARRERIERFTREARAAAGLQHPAIVRILDHGQVQGRYYIAMEFLQGQSLRDVLRQRGSLPPAEALRIAVAIADGLDYAHRRGVVHRDVKPDNVHLEPDGRVVLTDFGIARLTFEPTLTAAGQIFGTPSYMSPEQVSGKPVDARSDLFSLGVMLYEMVAGHKPFTGDTVVTITYNIVNMEPPPIPGAPAGLDGVIRRAMAKDPARRYASAAEMAADLRRVQSGQAPLNAVAFASPARPMAVSTAPGPAPASSAIPAVAARRPITPPAASPRYGLPPARLPPAGVPAGVTPPPATSPPYPDPAPPHYGYPGDQPLRRTGMDLKWMLGWMGVAAVVGCLILFLVWAGVQSFQRFESTTTAGAVQRQMDEADAAFRQKDFARALEAYLAAAKTARGPVLAVARKNAGVAAYELSLRELEAGKPDQAEAYARRALELDESNLLGMVALGRAMARNGRAEEALSVLDQAHAAALARKDTANATAAILWKADTLYNDGVANMERDAGLARRRFEAVLQVAPNTMYSRNAQTFLARLNYGPGGGTELQGALPETQIPGFDPGFRNPFGGQPASGGSGVGSPGGAGGLPGGFDSLLKGLQEGLREP